MSSENGTAAAVHGSWQTAPDGGGGGRIGSPNKAATQPAHRLVVTRGIDVEPEDLCWLWHGRLPLGKLVMLVGDPGLGKTFLAMKIAATVTRGLDWPDGAGGVEGSVLVVSGEDGVGDTLAPRLRAMGADMSRIDFLEGISVPGKRHAGAFTLTHDSEQLDAYLTATPDTRLIIIDPITAFLPDINSHETAAVRSVLSPLAAVAQRHGATIVCLAHLNKVSGSKAVYRINGSGAFPQAARLVWLVAEDPGDEGARIMAQAKNNLSPKQPALRFRVTGDPAQVEWIGGSVDMDADDVLRQIETAKAEPGGIDPAAWLRSALAGGRRSVADLRKEARDAHGIGRARFDAAMRELRLTPRREGFGSAGWWYLELPAVPVAHAEMGGDDDE